MADVKGISARETGAIDQAGCAGDDLFGASTKFDELSYTVHGAPSGGPKALRWKVRGPLRRGGPIYFPSTIRLRAASPFGCIGPIPVPGMNQMPFSLAWQ